MTRMSRPLASALLLTAALVVLSGCAASDQAPTMDSTAASERYEPVMAELMAALDEAYPEVVWSDQGDAGVQADGDGCVLVLGTQRAEPSLWKAAGEDWNAVAQVVDPVLEGGELEPVTKQAFEGGWTGVTSRDDKGADFEISDKSYTLVTLSVPVTDSSC